MAARTVDQSPSGDGDLSHLVVRRRALSDPSHLAWAIHAASSWLGADMEAPADGMHRYRADFRLRVSEHSSLVTFRKAAYIDIGPVRPLNDGWEAEIGWRASTLAPLFPVFSGTIVAHREQLTISGWYAPPGGAIGRIADRVLMHIAAEGTARWLLRELDDAAAQGTV